MGKAKPRVREPKKRKHSDDDYDPAYDPSGGGKKRGAVGGKRDPRRSVNMDIELYMECENDDLSHAQTEWMKKITKEYNATLTLIRNARKDPTVQLVRLLKHDDPLPPMPKPPPPPPVVTPPPPQQQPIIIPGPNAVPYPLQPMPVPQPARPTRAAANKSVDAAQVILANTLQIQKQLTQKIQPQRIQPRPQNNAPQRVIPQQSGVPWPTLVPSSKRGGGDPKKVAVVPSKRPAILAKPKTKEVPKAVTPKKVPLTAQSIEDVYYGRCEGASYYKEEKGEFRFKCWQCNKMLYNNLKVMLHTQAHIDCDKQQNLDLSDLTQCKHCYKQFDTPFEMQTHIEKVHSAGAENVLMCRICEKDHVSLAALGQHMTMSHVACEMPYVCQLCNFRSSVYQETVDHFNKKHGSSSNMMCVYCLKVFRMSRSTSAGWCRTMAYFQHLLKHQAKSGAKKCPSCKLVFFNTLDVKMHKLEHHLVNKRNAKGEPLQSLTLKTLPPVKSTALKSLNDPAFLKRREFSTVAIPDEVEDMKCFECGGLIHGITHFRKYVECSLCRYATLCDAAYTNHMTLYHTSTIDTTSVYVYVPKEKILDKTMFCICGYSCDFGNMFANHLVSCTKIEGYLYKPATPPPSDTLEKSSSLLDILGLMKKGDSNSNSPTENKEFVSDYLLSKRKHKRKLVLDANEHVDKQRVKTSGKKREYLSVKKPSTPSVEKVVSKLVMGIVDAVDTGSEVVMDEVVDEVDIEVDERSMDSCDNEVKDVDEVRSGSVDDQNEDSNGGFELMEMGEDSNDSQRFGSQKSDSVEIDSFSRDAASNENSNFGDSEKNLDAIFGASNENSNFDSSEKNDGSNFDEVEKNDDSNKSIDDEAQDSNEALEKNETLGAEVEPIVKDSNEVADQIEDSEEATEKTRDLEDSSQILEDTERKESENNYENIFESENISESENVSESQLANEIMEENAGNEERMESDTLAEETDLAEEKDLAQNEEQIETDLLAENVPHSEDGLPESGAGETQDLDLEVEKEKMESVDENVGDDNEDNRDHEIEQNKDVDDQETKGLDDQEKIDEDLPDQEEKIAENLTEKTQDFDDQENISETENIGGDTQEEENTEAIEDNETDVIAEDKVEDVAEMEQEEQVEAKIEDTDKEDVRGEEKLQDLSEDKATDEAIKEDVPDEEKDNQENSDDKQETVTDIKEEDEDDKKEEHEDSTECKDEQVEQPTNTESTDNKPDADDKKEEESADDNPDTDKKVEEADTEGKDDKMEESSTAKPDTSDEVSKVEGTKVDQTERTEEKVAGDLGKPEDSSAAKPEDSSAAKPDSSNTMDDQLEKTDERSASEGWGADPASDDRQKAREREERPHHEERTDDRRDDRYRERSPHQRDDQRYHDNRGYQGQQGQRYDNRYDNRNYGNDRRYDNNSGYRNDYNNRGGGGGYYGNQGGYRDNRGGGYRDNRYDQHGNNRRHDNRDNYNRDQRDRYGGYRR